MQLAPDSPIALVTSDSDSQFAAAVTAVTSAFGDPTRREIYLFVRSNPGATSSEVAASFSLHPNVARHHLERLAAGGYLEITMERAAGNGAGRPSKRFRAIGNDPTLDLLTRRDDLLVLLLQEALQMLGPLACGCRGHGRTGGRGVRTDTGCADVAR